MEKEIVRYFIYPVFVHPNHTHMFNDQFAFGPQGLVLQPSFVSYTTSHGLLQTNEYVHIIALDFSKAFDTVKHSTLASKLADFPLPENALFFTGSQIIYQKGSIKVSSMA